jgi:hypothetical protein
MEQRRLPVPPQSVEQIQNFDRSIAHFSGEHTKLTLQLKNMIENIDALYQGRQAVLDKVITEAGIKQESIMQIRPAMLDGKLELQLLLKPTPPTPAPVVENSATVQESAPAEKPTVPGPYSGN